MGSGSFASETTIANSFTFENVHLPRRKKLIFEFFYRNNPGKGNTGGSSPRISVSEVSLNVTTKKVGFSAIDDTVDKIRPSKIFKKKSLHYHNTDTTKSKRFNSNMRVVSESLHKNLFIESNPSPVKYAAKLLGLCDDTVRLPLVKITENTKKEVEKALKVAKLIDE